MTAASVQSLDGSRLQAIDRLKQDLVLACHILERAGQGSGIGGHLTARLPGDNSFWSYQWHQAFEEVTYDDIIEADFGLETITGEGRVNPTLHIHTRIYAARPDVCCIIHTHPANAVALGVTGSNLEPIWQPAAIFYDDCVLFDEFDGVVLDTAEGDRIAQALGDKHAILLRNHGILVVSGTIRMGCIGALTIETVAEVQLKALSAGALKPMPREAALQTKAFLLSEDVTTGRWNYLTRSILRERPNLRRS